MKTLINTLVKSFSFLALLLGYYVTIGQCPPENSITLKSQEQLENLFTEFPNCTELNNKRITIYVNDNEFGTPIHDLRPFFQITKMAESSLVISRFFGNESLPALESLVGLNNVTELDRLTIRDDLYLKNLSALQNLRELYLLMLVNCQGIESLSFNEINVYGEFYLVNNSSLTDLGNITVSDEMNALTIEDNSNLITGSEFNNLSKVGGLILAHNDISFVANLVEVNSLDVTGNNTVQDLSDFKNLRSSNLRTVKLSSLEALSNLDIFNQSEVSNIATIELNNLPLLHSIKSLKRVSGILYQLRIESCPLITDLETFSNITGMTTMVISSMDGLTNLSGLNNISEISLTLIISDCSNLNSLYGLENLESIGSTFSFSRNPLIESFSRLKSLRSIGMNTATQTRLHIRSNDNLKSLAGLDDMFGQLDVFIITNNSLLETCHVQPICNSFDVAQSIDIRENNQGCNDEDEVNIQCYNPVVQKIFYDANENGFDENEIGVPIGYSIINSENILYPNNKGNINFVPNDSTFALAYNNPTSWLATTPKDISVNNSITIDTIRNGITPSEELSLLEARLSFSQLVCNKEYRIKITLMNKGTTFLNVGTSLSAVGDFLSADPKETSLNTSEVLHDVDSIRPGETKELLLTYQSPSVADFGLGSIFDHILEVEVYDLQNNFLFDNQVSYPIQFLCAYDPNDKQVFPQGEGDNNYTLFTDDTLEYLIRFQNTGNFPAEDIIITDTLDQNLDWTTFQFIAASHPVSEINLLRNVLTFEFQNIFLPDSVSNELGSHGFVSYTVGLKEGLSNYSTVSNTANIFFDQNPPIVTNTTLNTFVNDIPTVSTITLNSHSYLDIYPNPSDGIFNIGLVSEFYNKNWTLYSTNGIKVLSGSVDRNKIDLSIVEPGLYIIEVNGITSRIVLLK